MKLFSPQGESLRMAYDLIIRNGTIVDGLGGARRTSVGNCGVGFAPCRQEDHDVLVDVMAGVEDIPGVVMTDGLPWTWETFPEYMDALEAGKRYIAVAAYLPHSPLRVYFKGQRGAANA